jgi:predicted transcriptional regulator
MSKCNCSLGPLEKEILEIVWETDCPSVRCVLIEINKSKPSKDKLAYTTVMTILKRLVKKGILIRKKEGRGFRYQAKQTKSEFFQELAQYTIKYLKENYGQLAIKALKKELV